VLDPGADVDAGQCQKLASSSCTVQENANAMENNANANNEQRAYNSFIYLLYIHDYICDCVRIHIAMFVFVSECVCVCVCEVACSGA